MTNTLKLAQNIIKHGGMPPSDGVMDLAKAVVDVEESLRDLREKAISVCDSFEKEPSELDGWEISLLRRTATKKDASHE